MDCYIRDSARRLPYYEQMLAPHSCVTTVAAAELGSGFDSSRFDAVVLSGSQMMLSEESPPKGLVEFCRQLRLPVLGICFGHQLLAYSFGAVVIRGELQERDETIFVDQLWPLLRDLGPGTVMRESHREFVTPESLQKIGWQVGAHSAVCPTEAIRHPSLPLYGVQFHPERSGRPGELLFAAFFREVVRAHTMPSGVNSHCH